MLTLFPEDDFPVLLSTNRHITQGWPELEALATDRARMTISGASRVRAGADTAWSSPCRMIGTNLSP